MKRERLLKRLEERLQVEFKDTSLLETVFVHSSYANEKKAEGLESNERLEFLGDAVLSAIISDILYRAFPHLDEGRLTRIRARVVNRKVLAEVSEGLELGGLLLLGRGEEKAGGRKSASILADTLEALIAAIYLDRGYRKTYQTIKRLFSPLIALYSEKEVYFDFKPILQEIAQKHFKEAPCYRVIKEEGPSHRKIFSVEVVLKGRVLGRAKAGRKKTAEQLSARSAIEVLKKEGYTL